MNELTYDGTVQQLSGIVDRYLAVRGERESRSRDFAEGRRSYLIHQEVGDGSIYCCSNPEESFKANIEAVALSLETPSDHLQVMEPWFGTGVYANMYGCPYYWRSGESPCVRYKYFKLDEIRTISKPRWEDGEITHMVLETIRYFKSKTGDAIPIVWTDTQSASDTAALILDATELFAGCLVEPETVRGFMQDINGLIVEFSKVQSEVIGDALVEPGHMFVSNVGLRGMSISDDNLAVASPKVNADFNLPLDEQIGRAMGGVAIHSCGNWAHTMPMIKEKVPSCVAIDCAIENVIDPTPNEPEKVRDAFAGTSICVHVRVTGNTQHMLESVKRLLHPHLKLIVQPFPCDMRTAERDYEALDSLLSEYYAPTLCCGQPGPGEGASGEVG